MSDRQGILDHPCETKKQKTKNDEAEAKEENKQQTSKTQSNFDERKNHACLFSIRDADIARMQYKMCGEDENERKREKKKEDKDKRKK